ncbi:peptidase zinc-dependent [Natronorubrum sp. FCH18a]|uniref:peptidase zinc-dependent n=1 Tax=Natronorubrum sp. FCH18a TaxID=3447018 RepID=UPI003F51551C
MAVFPHGTPRVAVVPIGEPPATACDVVAETLRETFELSVPIRQAIDAPLDAASDDANAEPFLECVRDETEGIDLAIGVTDAALRQHASDPPLFGVGLEFGTVGVVSTARLLEGAEPSALECERLAKEALSVAGTTFGLRTYLHDGSDTDDYGETENDEDDEQPCVVAPGDALFQLDGTPATYCDDCRAALTNESPFFEPPRPDAWVVRPRDEEVLTFADRWARGERRWRDYPLLAMGFVVATARPIGSGVRSVLGRLPRPGSISARQLPQPVHTTYRIVRFWTNIFCYLGCIVVWLYALVTVHDWLFGSAYSTVGLVGVLGGGLVAGIVTGLFLKAIAAGVYDGLRGVPVEGPH